MIGLGFCREHKVYGASFGYRSQAKTTKNLAPPANFSTTPVGGSPFQRKSPAAQYFGSEGPNPKPTSRSRHYEADGPMNQTETPSKFALLSSELPDCVDITSSAPTLDGAVADA